MSNLIAHASDLLREMDRDGDGWHGRAAPVLQDLLARVAELELRRSETAAMCVQLQAENARLQEYLEASAWRISPAMAQAKVDELNATVERLTAERGAITVMNPGPDVTDLIQQFATVTAERDALLADHSGDANKKVCLWTETKDGQYETACGEMYEFYDGGPKDNRIQFCGYCGKSLIEQRWAEPIPLPKEGQ